MTALDRIRQPTDREIALAWRYVRGEFRLSDDGRIPLDYLVEGLGHVDDFPGPLELYCTPREIAEAAGIQAQFDADTWRMLAAQADRERAHSFGIGPLFEIR